MNVKRWLVTIACFCSGVQALASGLTCSSVDQKLSYQFTVSDGGPAVAGPAENLTVDGKILIRRVMFGPEKPIHLASMEFIGKKEVTGTKSTQYWKTEFFVQELKVISSEAEGIVLFSDPVFCRSDRYVGPPIP